MSICLKREMAVSVILLLNAGLSQGLAGAGKELSSDDF